LDYKEEFLNSDLLISKQPSYRPAQVILLRHAEKPLEGPFLSEQGQRRASMLPLIAKILAENTTPLIWNKNHFDRFWVLKYSENSYPVHLEIIQNYDYS
jgi:hypothetical protein